ncbi:MAG: plastocyanin/azurin family copper-binding protein [Candidatus Aquilonibacter sp.]
MNERAAALALVMSLAGCTAGGVDASTTGSSAVSSITTVDVSIAAFGAQSTPVGPALGYSPASITIPVGSGVRFVNVDNTTHTVTAIPGATTFPSVSPFTASALQPGATSDLSGAWGAGALQPGGASGVFVANTAGTYLYGCFFHYSGGMRGVIIAR